MGGRVIYQSTQNFPGQVQNIFFKLGGQPSGRYWPESGRRSKKTLKNRHFFEVFEMFDGLMYEISAWPANTT